MYYSQQEANSTKVDTGCIQNVFDVWALNYKKDVVGSSEPIKDADGMIR
jgi:hypothetical protein